MIRRTVERAFARQGVTFTAAGWNKNWLFARYNDKAITAYFNGNDLGGDTDVCFINVRRANAHDDPNCDHFVGWNHRTIRGAVQDMLDR